MHYGIELCATGVCGPRPLAELASLAEAVGHCELIKHGGSLCVRIVYLPSYYIYK